jgi:hypothetical protein
MTTSVLAFGRLRAEVAEHGGAGLAELLTDQRARRELIGAEATRAARELPEPPAIDLPSPGDLELDPVRLPRPRSSPARRTCRRRRPWAGSLETVRVVA